MAGVQEKLPLLNSTRDAEQASSRKRLRVLVLVGAVVLAVTLVVFSYASSSYKNPRIVSFKRAYNTYRETFGFNGVAQVTENGTTVFSVWHGHANEEFDVPMQPDYLFPIGSNSKLFTSVALYQLEEAGQVNLSDPVNNWLKQDDFVQFGYPNQTKWCPRLANATADSPCEQITFVQLLHMSSGIGNSVNCDNVDPDHCYRSAEDLGYYKGSIGVYVGRFINDPLVFKPGTNYSYANPNFVLLSYLVEKISGQSFGGYLKEHIFDKLGLKDTIYDPYAGALSVNHRVVDEYRNFFIQGDGDEMPRLVSTGTCSPLFNSGAISGAGGLKGTVNDLERLYTDLFHDRGRQSKILSAESIRKIVTRTNPVSPTYGQGVIVRGVTEDDWPEAVMYCGGVKCTATCIAMLVANPESSVVSTSFSNHVNVVFPSQEALDQYHPDVFMYNPPESANITSSDSGGAMELLQEFMKAYVYAETPMLWKVLPIL